RARAVSIWGFLTFRCRLGGIVVQLGRPTSANVDEQNAHALVQVTGSLRRRRLPLVGTILGTGADQLNGADQGAAALAPRTGAGEGGVATAVWAPPQLTLAIATDLPDQDEYEVRVYDNKRPRRLVAAMEIVNPANKDRREHRRVFAARCAALLRQHVSVAI